MSSNYLFRNATVVDGTGAPAQVADVAVREGRIASVGECPALGDEKSRWTPGTTSSGPRPLPQPAEWTRGAPGGHRTEPMKDTIGSPMEDLLSYGLGLGSFQGTSSPEGEEYASPTWVSRDGHC